MSSLYPQGLREMLQIAIKSGSVTHSETLNADTQTDDSNTDTIKLNPNFVASSTQPPEQEEQPSSSDTLSSPPLEQPPPQATQNNQPEENIIINNDESVDVKSW